MMAKHKWICWLHLIPAIVFGAGCVTSNGKSTPLQLSIIASDDDAAQLFGRTYDVTGLRLNLLGATNRNVTGMDLGGLNGCTGDMTGVQVGALSSLVLKNVSGIQIAGVVAGCEETIRGAEIGGLAALCYKGGTGFQAAGGLAKTGGEFSCAQFSVLSCVSRSGMSGVQMGGIAAVKGDMTGVQVSLLCSRHFDGTLRGVEASMLWNMAGSWPNERPSEVHGLQIGMINYAQRLNGAQIGLINVSRDGGLPFCPFINFSFFSPRKGLDAQIPAVPPEKSVGPGDRP